MTRIERLWPAIAAAAVLLAGLDAVTGAVSTHQGLLLTLLSPLAGLDIMAQARSGLMSITGTPDGDPVKVGVPVCDLVCALYGALAAVSALRVRERAAPSSG